ncbi:MAG: hypothetical protein V2A73_18250 [Pseudomonadota bacterium]
MKRPASTALPVAVTSILHSVRLHPRVAYQGVYAEPSERKKLLDQLPALMPFANPYLGAVAVIDWDHRLPSKVLTLRIFVYHSEATLAAGEEAFDDRLELIGSRDRFPEFDVPDFTDLPADEAYEIQIEADGKVSSCRLTSAWRRDVEEDEEEAAVAIVRVSSEFIQVAAAAQARPRYLGDPEAVSWTPPCESSHSHWTLDVWYLLAFDGRIGSGLSFLVDLEDNKVVAVREFSVKTG